MVRFLLVAAVSIALVLAGCAHDVRTRYPSEPGEPTGSIVLVLTRASSGVIVAINGNLIVNGAHTQHIRIDGVATGYAELTIAIGDGAQQQKIWVESDRDTVVPIGAPQGLPGAHIM
jgi:hypothetical protein